MLINFFIVVLILRNPRPGLSGKFDIKTQCMDPVDRSIHELNGDPWKIDNECKLKYCLPISNQNSHNTTFAIITETNCQTKALIPGPELKCFNSDKVCVKVSLQETSGTSLDFPDCCEKLVCICGSRILIWETDKTGKITLIRKRAVTQLISEAPISSSTISTTSSESSEVVDHEMKHN